MDDGVEYGFQSFGWKMSAYFTERGDYEDSCLKASTLARVGGDPRGTKGSGSRKKHRLS